MDLKMNLKAIKKSKGLTLVELLIALSITAIIGTVLVAILIQNSQTFWSENSKITQGLSQEKAISEIKESIRIASSVSNNCPQPTCPSDYSSDLNTLVLKLPSLDSENNIIKDVYDYMVIKADSGNPLILKKIVYVSNQSYRKKEDLVMTTSLSQIKFYYLDQNGNILSPTEAKKISFIINQKQVINLKEVETTASAIMSLRNM